MSYNHICHEDRLFPADSQLRSLAKEMYKEIAGLPIISPHGHTDPKWFSENKNFTNAADTFVTPDHYILRMLYSQGVVLQNLKPNEVWQQFARNFYLFRGTPTWLWMNSVFHNIFGMVNLLTEKNADEYFNKISEQLASPSFKPRELLKKFNIEAIATTDHAMDDLADHKVLLQHQIRVVPTFRPDRLTNPEHPEHALEMKRLAEGSKENLNTFSGFLSALRERRQYFIKHGATAADHGHPDAFTCFLSGSEIEKLYAKIRKGEWTADDAQLFRGHMICEMAKMSLEDGLVMQFHSGVYRNHNQLLYKKFGADLGADIPVKAEFVRNLKPLLDLYGNEKNLNLILFTLDESTYARELAPLAGHYPSLKLGAAWWFHDSVEGMRRFREQCIETAGFYNHVGFIDDTRAFFSIPSRHDVARRMDCNILSSWVAEHRMTMTEAIETLKDITYTLPKRSFRL